MRKIKKINIEATKNNYNSFFVDLGEQIIFTQKVVKQFFKPPYEHKELIKQSYYIGNKTLPLIAITGFIMGLVLTMQTRPALVDFGAQSLLPGMISLSIIREIGPMITGLLCAGKISSGIAAEIGAMKVSEQIDAMEVSGTKPLGFVVASRVMSTTLLVPLLVFFADAFGFLGAFMGVNLNETMTFKLFISKAFEILEFTDILPATIKSVFFGFFIGIIGSYKGYQASGGTESVGLAANSAVVNASLTIFVIDLIAVLITNLL